MKTLKVLLSEKLPPIEKRDTNTMYFTYDKLEIYLGQNKYYDNYAIISSLPEDPIFGMIYIDLSDGYAKSYIDYNWNNIAKIEDEEQLQKLKNTGAVFFVNTDRRYLDKNRRTITLPYNNGSYELTVGIPNELIFDENTIIKYNKKTEKFEIYGKHDDYGMIFLTEYTSKDTKSVKMNVEKHKISSEVKLSDEYNNLIEVMQDGLYANGLYIKNLYDVTNKFVPYDYFVQWVKSYQGYKEKLDQGYKDLEDKTQGSIGNISDDVIAEKINDAVMNASYEMEQIIKEYSYFRPTMEGIEDRSKEYTDKTFNDTYEKLVTYAIKVNGLEWEDF